MLDSTYEYYLRHRDNIRSELLRAARRLTNDDGLVYGCDDNTWTAEALVDEFMDNHETTYQLTHPTWHCAQTWCQWTKQDVVDALHDYVNELRRG